LSCTSEEVSLQNWIGGPLGTSELLLLGARAGVADGVVSLLLRCTMATPAQSVDALLSPQSDSIWELLCRNIQELAEGESDSNAHML
jgi:hypothetical protein